MSGISTNTAYITRAGVTYSQPLVFSRLSFRKEKNRREGTGAIVPLSVVVVDEVLVLEDAGIVTRLLWLFS